MVSRRLEKQSWGGVTFFLKKTVVQAGDMRSTTMSMVIPNRQAIDGANMRQKWAAGNSTLLSTFLSGCAFAITVSHGCQILQPLRIDLHQCPSGVWPQTRATSRLVS